MSRLIVVLLAILLAAVLVWAQAPDTLWTRTFGGQYGDVGNYVQQTNEGGFIIVGYHAPFQAAHYDIWLIKTDSSGDTLWTKSYGSNNYNDYGNCVQQTTDGGYIIVGSTEVSSLTLTDVYLLKVSINGDTLWTRTYGGENYDYGNCVQQTTDGGYIVVGVICSAFPYFDLWLIKTNSEGDTLWTRTYGGLGSDFGRSVQQTTDGGYIVVGYTSVNFFDVWLLKTDTNGDTLWTRTYGYSRDDCGWSVKQTEDGGYIIVGFSEITWQEDYDIWLIKADANGDTLWTRTYGGDYWDFGYDVQETDDNGFIITGSIEIDSMAQTDLWLIKTNASGDTLWTCIYGGDGLDEGYCVQQTADRCYVIVGRTSSYGAGNDDVWLIKTEPDVAQLTISLVPYNPPIQIPSGGGSFLFDTIIENNTNNPINFDAWSEVLLPNGQTHGPIIIRTGLTIQPDTSVMRTLTQYIPANAPTGDYWYKGYVGTYPNVVVSVDSFAFEKLSGNDLPSHNNGWQLFGRSSGEAVNLKLPNAVCFSAYPNPFNQVAHLTFYLPQAGEILLSVYDVQGREVARLADGFYQASTYQVAFSGSQLPSGIYFIHLSAAHVEQTQKLLLVK